MSKKDNQPTNSNGTEQLNRTPANSDKGNTPTVISVKVDNKISAPGNHDAANTPPPKKDRYKKPNFYKYELVKEDLIKQLDGTRTATEISKNLALSVTTFFKYKALACTQAPAGQALMTLEEKIFNDKYNTDKDEDI